MPRDYSAASAASAWVSPDSRGAEQLGGNTQAECDTSRAEGDPMSDTAEYPTSGLRQVVIASMKPGTVVSGTNSSSMPPR